MPKHTMGANLQSPLHFSINEVDLLQQIGGDPLAGSGFETEDPNRGFALTEVVGPEPNALAEE